VLEYARRMRKERKTRRDIKAGDTVAFLAFPAFLALDAMRSVIFILHTFAQGSCP